MAAVRPLYAYVLSDGEPGLWHEVLAMEAIGAVPPHSDDWVIATVDGDMYAETIAAPPHLDIRW